MKKMMLLLTLLVSMLTVQHAVAQELKDYVITMEGDTIYGEMGSVKSKKVYMLVKGEKKVYFPPQLYRIYNHNTGKHYAASFIELGMKKVKGSKPQKFIIKEKVKLKNKPIFTEILQDGEIIVYNFTKTTGGAATMGPGGAMIPGFASSSKYHYALKRSTGEIIELKVSGLFVFGGMSKKKRNLNIMEILEDEPELVERLQQEKKLNYDIFFNYIKEYNTIKQDKNKYPLEIF